MNPPFLQSLDLTAKFRNIDIRQSASNDSKKSDITMKIDNRKRKAMRKNSLGALGAYRPRALSTCSEPCQPTQSMIATERARRISQDVHMQRILINEVKKSGHVTTAGYKAELQKLVYEYSDAVEKDISNRDETGTSNLKTSKSGRFGSMISNMTASTVSASLTASNFSRGLNNSNLTASNFSRSLNKSNLSSSLTSQNHLDMIRRLSSEGSSAIKSNLAPRRQSTFASAHSGSDDSSPDEEQDTDDDDDDDDEEEEASLPQKFKPRRPMMRFGEVNFDPQVPKQHDSMTKRMEREANVPTIVAVKMEKATLDDSNTSRSDAGEVLQSILDAGVKGEFPSWPHQHGDDDNCDYSSASSCDCEECEDEEFGWLAWPKKENDNNISTNSIVDDYEDESSFLPWPVDDGD
mmetsp:Transcript_35255/g.74443  ORF Transcript_35255/g.74443 Transcript_35255/m.74443 type:complete len:407 (-) Transcript_35255:225-1445(-)